MQRFDTKPVDPLEVPESPNSFPLEPQITAKQLAQGWGFKHGGVIDTLRKQYPDFPPPVDDRRYPVWWYHSVKAWGDVHARSLRARLQTSRGKTARREANARILETIAPVVPEQAVSDPATLLARLEARIAELEAKLKGRD
jgi:hypothetical protein